MIEQLFISRFRNIKQSELLLHPRLNLIYGENGSGKTTILEAIYYSCCLRSFRSKSTSHLINSEEESFLLRSVSFPDDLNNSNTIGCEVKRNKEKSVKLNGTYIYTSSKIANLSPVVYVAPTATELVDGPPKLRRSYLDWVVFHVEPSYAKLVNEYEYALSSRNKLVKVQDFSQEHYWREILAKYGQQIHNIRSNVFSELSNYINVFTKTLLPNQFKSRI